MKTLWSPWRSEYIENIASAQKGAKDCIFCLPEGFAGPEPDRLVLYSDPLALAMMNLYPYNNGHLLIAPRRHIARLELATAGERLRLMDLCARATQAITQALGPDGFNIGVNQGRVAGAGIADHLHFHVVPRWEGDVNFMCSIAETKLVSQHLLTTYEKLKPHFAD